MSPCPNLVMTKDPYFGSGSWKSIIEAFVFDSENNLETEIGTLSLLFSLSKCFIDN